MTDHRAELPLIPYLVVPDLFLCLLIATQPSRLLRLLGFLLHTYISIQGLKFTTGDSLQDYGIGSTFSGQFFTALHLLWLTSPVNEFRHEQDRFERSASELPLWKRVWWTFCVNHSPRGVGWNYQVSNVPARPSQQRWSFIRSRLLKAARSFLLVDIAQAYLHLNPLFSLQGPEARSITSQGPLLLCVNIVAYMCTPYGMMNMQYSLLSAMSVALGISHASAWPDPYGSWVDAYTVRNFWGKTWHQMMRRYISSIGRFFSNLFGFQRGTSLSSYTQLYIGFIVSGIMHTAGGDAMVGYKYLGASLPFFLVQPLAITLEDLVIASASKAGLVPSTRLAKFLGYVWVFAWFMLSSPWYIDWSLRAGIGRSEVLPFSLTRTIWNIAAQAK